MSSAWAIKFKAQGVGAVHPALRLVEFYSSRCGSPAKPRRERPGDHIFSDAYGMRRLRGAAPRLPDVDAAPRSPASPSRPSTKGARKPNPLREFKLSTSARKFPRNPNPRSPPLPFVVAF